MIDERYLLDELEAGELAVEYDDQSPQTVIQWALEQYHPNIGLCTTSANNLPFGLRRKAETRTTQINLRIC